jgi:hypothetical protein
MRYHNILADYVRDYAIPAMLNEGWAFKAAKSHGWKYAARGADFHVDQPLRTHILNGLYAVTRILEYLDQHGYYHLSESDFKRVLVLYTTHDAYKDSDLARWRTGTSEFDIPLEHLEALLEHMGLRRFVSVKAEDLRAASVSLLSHKVADISSCTPGITRLLTVVHLADAFSSQQTARDYTTAENYLSELSKDDKVKALNVARINKRMDESPEKEKLLPKLKLYYHELDDYRGLSTLLLHQSTQDVLAPLGLHPLLYFANGILYVGPTDIAVDIEDVHAKIASLLFSKVRQEGGTEKLTIARSACDPRKGMKIEKYAYLFCPLDYLLDAVIEETRLSNAKGAISQALPDYASYAIPPESDKEALQAQHWLAVTKLVMATENIAQALVPGNILEWLFTTFHTPESVATLIRGHISQLYKGGVPKYCYIIAYHWLIQVHFPPDSRSWLEVDTASIQNGVKDYILRALAPYDTEERILSFVEKELGIRGDVYDYLRSTLILSFDSTRFQQEDSLKEYEKERRKSHKRLCTICNRLITPQVSKKSTEIKTAIAEQPAQIFSNRRVPTLENNGDMMVWCPMCYLEFMLRKLSGQSYPDDSDYNASYRLNLYILPDYSFTPELWTATGEALLQEFHPKSTTVTKLALRGNRDDPSLPRRWLEHHTVDRAWLEQTKAIFAEQAKRLKTRKQGDRLTFSFMHPNYMLFTYDNVVSRGADSSLKPTHIEVWVKALYSAVLLHLLTGARIYITDKPYLTFTRPELMKTIIEMEGLHPLLYGLFPTSRDDIETTDMTQRASETSARLPLVALSTMLDLLAATWEINAGLSVANPNEFRNLDKQVASILEEVRMNYLAGATLYKMRERDKAAPYQAFTKACQILLPQEKGHTDNVRHALYSDGYTLMLDKEGGTLMELAQELTDLSLQLYLPLSQPRQGRAHRFESIFRTGIEVIKSNARREDTTLIGMVAGHLLKRLARISGGVCPTIGAEQNNVAQRFAELLVKQLYNQYCGHSISRLTHSENALADAIYFFTAQQIGERWKTWKERKKTTESEAPSTETDLAE